MSRSYIHHHFCQSPVRELVVVPNYEIRNIGVKDTSLLLVNAERVVYVLQLEVCIRYRFQRFIRFIFAPSRGWVNSTRCTPTDALRVTYLDARTHIRLQIHKGPDWAAHDVSMRELDCEGWIFIAVGKWRRAC